MARRDLSSERFHLPGLIGITFGVFSNRSGVFLTGKQIVGAVEGVHSG
jgi:hypothetical protein